MSVRHRLFAVWLACLVAGAIIGAARHEEPTRLTFLAVGQGDCAVFQHAGSTVLIDAGPNTDGVDAGERIVVPRLNALGVRSVDLILLTHPDEDHIGGVSAILRAYPHARLLISDGFKEHPTIRARMAEWEEGRVTWLHENAAFNVDRFRFSIRCPKPVFLNDNSGSLFIRIDDGDSSAILTGDADAATEEHMAQDADWSADLMTAGHHGSNTSTSEEWLDEVHPALVVISCGRTNRYGHPHANVLARLQEHHVGILRTDQDGEIRLRPENGGWVRE